MTMLLSAVTSFAQQGAQVPDSLRADSIAVASPLPSPALGVVRFLFNAVPQWVQIAGVFLVAIAVLILLVLGWRHHEAVFAWFGAKSRAWKMGFAAIVLVVLGGIGFAGNWSWHYMMHDNEFCAGCHIMNVPFERFGTSEHAKLGCHDCHRQSIFASTKELYIQVTERPDKIPASHLPNVCAECHIQRGADSTWKRVSATAGHQVHLNPNSPAMSKIECTTCHAQQVHRFKPVGQTCAQSGCHDAQRVDLGKMADQSDLHCIVCHEFTVPSTEGNPVDSSRAALIPTDEQCLGVDMRSGWAFARERAPQRAAAPSQPHAQTTPDGAQTVLRHLRVPRAVVLIAMHRSPGRHRLQTCAPVTALIPGKRTRLIAGVVIPESGIRR
jgi:nitrate/TMAO reductase-like tetraheme cytochrome c subunit